jgi:hypothetical protein
VRIIFPILFSLVSIWGCEQPRAVHYPTKLTVNRITVSGVRIVPAVLRQDLGASFGTSYIASPLTSFSISFQLLVDGAPIQEGQPVLARLILPSGKRYPINLFITHGINALVVVPKGFGDAESMVLQLGTATNIAMSQTTVKGLPRDKRQLREQEAGPDLPNLTIRRTGPYVSFAWTNQKPDQVKSFKIFRSTYVDYRLDPNALEYPPYGAGIVMVQCEPFPTLLDMEITDYRLKQFSGSARIDGAELSEKFGKPVLKMTRLVCLNFPGLGAFTFEGKPWNLVTAGRSKTRSVHIDFTRKSPVTNGLFQTLNAVAVKPNLGQFGIERLALNFPDFGPKASFNFSFAPGPTKTMTLPPIDIGFTLSRYVAVGKTRAVTRVRVGPGYIPDAIPRVIIGGTQVKRIE